MTFQEAMERAAGRALAGAEPLAGLPYEEELILKRTAFAEFWESAGLPNRPEPVVPAPQPRHYRATSKRRVTWIAPGRIAVDHLRVKKPGLSAPSLLEPEGHSLLYRHCHKFLSHKGDQSLGRALNWITIRGNRMVVLVVDHMDAGVVRQARKLAGEFPGLGFDSCMLYADPSRSAYYLEAERPTGGLAAKHLFGPRILTLRLEDAGEKVLLKYPPTVFSQVNEAMVPRMIAVARELLNPESDDRLLDLYCGYGLFSFTIGRDCRETVGVELAGDAIETARETVKRRQMGKRFLFTPARIEKEVLKKRLPRAGGKEVVLLDPPRKGPAPGVISAIADRRPRRILHIACGTDELVPAINAWTGSRYRLQRAVPLDLFPGTIGLETLAVFVPDNG